MKYEMIFGDESLFDGAPEDSEIVVSQGQWYKTKSGKLYRLTPIQWKEVQVLGHTPLAMRRITPEPKRWTWEDKRAGRLPEVLGKVTTYDGKTYLFVGESCHDNQWSLKDDATGKVYHTPIGDIFPIETPAEKAQREEDEFVSGIVFEYNKTPSSVLFEAGIRAAYRKLKGGESEC